MYLLIILFGFVAVCMMLRGSLHERKLREYHYRKTFHTRLVKHEPGCEPCVRPLCYAHYVIGRRKRKSDLAVESDLSVSRVHAVLSYRGSRYFVSPIYHPRLGGSTAYYSQVMVNREPVPPEGRMVDSSDDIRIGQTHLYLEEDVPERVPFRPTFLIPLFAAAFILALRAFVCREAAAAELPLGSFPTATVLVLAFLVLGCGWALVSGTPMVAFTSAVSILLMMHNCYMIFFESEAGYLSHMAIFIALFLAGFLVLRHQQWLTVTPALFWLLAGAVVGLIVINLIFGKGSQYSSARLWIRIGGLSIQPGEIVKPLLALLGAMCYRDHKRFWIYFAVTAFVCGSLLLKDFGNVFVIFCMLLLMIYLLHDNITVSLLTIALSVAAFLMLLAVVPYAAQRFDNWGNAMSNPNSYQQKQIITSVLFGGFGGLGFEDHRLATGIFAASSDSALAGIHAVYGVPVLVVTLAAYACIVFQSCSNSSVYPMGNLLLVQSALVMFLQVVLNYAGSLDLLFFTGVTAPMVSSGGSAMVSNGLFMAMIAASLCPAVKRAQ